MKLLKKLSCAVVGAASAVLYMTSPFLMNEISVSAAEDYSNFAKALQYSIYFYDTPDLHGEVTVTHMIHSFRLIRNIRICQVNL